MPTLKTKQIQWADVAEPESQQQTWEDVASPAVEQPATSTAVMEPPAGPDMGMMEQLRTQYIEPSLPVRPPDFAGMDTVQQSQALYQYTQDLEQAQTQIPEAYRASIEKEARELINDPVWLLSRKLEPSLENVIFGTGTLARKAGKPVREKLFGKEASPEALARANELMDAYEYENPPGLIEKGMAASPALALDLANFYVEIRLTKGASRFMGLTPAAQVISGGFKAALVRQVPSLALLFGARAGVEAMAKGKGPGQAAMEAIPEAGTGAALGVAGAVIETFGPKVLPYLKHLYEQNRLRYHRVVGKTYQKLGMKAEALPHLQAAKGKNYQDALKGAKSDVVHQQVIAKPAPKSEHKLTPREIELQAQGKTPGEAQQAVLAEQRVVAEARGAAIAKARFEEGKLGQMKPKAVTPTPRQRIAAAKPTPIPEPTKATVPAKQPIDRFAKSKQVVPVAERADINQPLKTETEAEYKERLLRQRMQTGRALEANPDDPRLLADLANLKARLGEKDAASELQAAKKFAKERYSEGYATTEIANAETVLVESSKPAPAPKAAVPTPRQRIVAAEWEQLKSIDPSAKAKTAEGVVLPTKSAPAKQPWESSDLATTPNIPIGQTQALKQTNGKWKLFFRGTRNEVFQGETFASASEAKTFFKVQQIKAQESTAPKPLQSATPAPSAPAKPKQPWEVTKAEWLDSQLSKQGQRQTKKSIGNLSLKEWKLQEHVAKVKQALSEGKPVPQEVLAEYPELSTAEPLGAQPPTAASKKPGHILKRDVQDAEKAWANAKLRSPNPEQDMAVTRAEVKYIELKAKPTPQKQEIPSEQPTESAVQPSGAYTVEYEAPSGFQTKVAVYRIKYQDASAEIQSAVDNAIPKQPNLSNKEAMALYNARYENKPITILDQKAEGEDPYYSISLEKPKDVFKRDVLRRELYNGKFNTSAQKAQSELEQEKQAANIAQQQKEELLRKEREAEHLAGQERIAYWDQQSKQAKFVKGEADIVRIQTDSQGKQREIKDKVSGVIYKGLLVHKTPGLAHGSTGWSLTHIKSGLRGASFDTRKEAKIAAIRISEFADFTTTQTELFTDKKRARTLGGIFRAMGSGKYTEYAGGVYADLSAYEEYKIAKPAPRGKGGAFKPDPIEKITPKGEGGFVRLGPSEQPPKTSKPWLDLKKTQSPDPGVQDFFGRTDKLYNTKTKLRRAAEAAKTGLQERFVFLPKLAKTPEYAFARDAIRTMPEQTHSIRQKAVDDVARILDGTGDRQALDNAGLDLLRRKVFTEDLLVEAQRAESEAQAYMAENPKATAAELDRIRHRRFPRGVNKAKLQAEKARLDGLISEVPSVQDALKMREQLWTDVSANLVERGVISEEAAANKAYIRHFVLEHMDPSKWKRGLRAMALKKPYRAYAKTRKGTTKDISTDYLEVEVKALADIYRDNAVEDLAGKIAKQYDQTGKLKKDVAKINQQAGKDVTSVERLARDRGLVPWQFKRGNIVYRTNSLSDYYLAKLAEEAANLESPEGFKIPVESLRAALAIGGKRKIWFLPEELAAQLDDLPVRYKPGTVVSFTAPVVQTWKRWILRVNPIRYNMRNMIGDSERVVASGKIKAFKRVPEAVASLFNHSSPEAHPLAYDKAVEYGAVGSSLWHEMGQARKIKEFQRFTTVDNPTAMKKAIAALKWAPGKASQFGQGLQDMTQHREDLLRMAVYLDALDDIDAFLKTGKPLRHWAGSRQQIEALAKTDKYRAAAKISRETLGDYGRFTPWEQYTLRQGLIPFYSWMKLNTTFWPRTFAEAAKEGVSQHGKAGALLGIGKWLAPIALGYGAIYLWNHRDDESRKKEGAMPPWLKYKPHLLVGDGVVYSPSAASDFLEWFDLESAAPELRRWERGQITTSQLLRNLMMIESKAPANRIIQALNPFLKTPFTLYGMSTFPDAFDPRPFAQAFSNKAIATAVLDVLGSDVRRFYNVNQGKITLREALSYYFSGSSYRPLSVEDLYIQIQKAIKANTLKRKSKTTGRKPGEAKKGREREVDILRNRMNAL